MVVVKKATELKTFTATDGSTIAEVINPSNDPTTEGVSLARAVLPPGASSKPHYLDIVEIHYVLKGRGVLHAGDWDVKLEPEVCVYIPPGTVQWTTNTGEEPLVFLCVCHPGWKARYDHPAPKGKRD